MRCSARRSIGSGEPSAGSTVPTGPTQCTLHTASSTLNATPNAAFQMLHVVPLMLQPSRKTPNSTSCTLHPECDTLHDTRHRPHPACQTVQDTCQGQTLHATLCTTHATRHTLLATQGKLHSLHYVSRTGFIYFTPLAFVRVSSGGGEVWW